MEAAVEEELTATTRTSSSNAGMSGKKFLAGLPLWSGHRLSDPEHFAAASARCWQRKLPCLSLQEGLPLRLFRPCHPRLPHRLPPREPWAAPPAIRHATRRSSPARPRARPYSPTDGHSLATRSHRGHQVNPC